LQKTSVRIGSLCHAELRADLWRAASSTADIVLWCTASSTADIALWCTASESSHCGQHVARRLPPWHQMKAVRGSSNRLCSRCVTGNRLCGRCVAGNELCSRCVTGNRLCSRCLCGDRHSEGSHYDGAAAAGRSNVQRTSRVMHSGILIRQSPFGVHKSMALYDRTAQGPSSTTCHQAAEPSTEQLGSGSTAESFAQASSKLARVSTATCCWGAACFRCTVVSSQAVACSFARQLHKQPGRVPHAIRNEYTTHSKLHWWCQRLDWWCQRLDWLGARWHVGMR
jgi:hypothetical protein